MDCEVLIACVKERPAIWDITNKNHHNRHMLDKLWDEIRKKVGSSKDRCRKKWKYLKDRFRAELRKERVSIRSGKTDPFDFKTKFAYFGQMSFMRTQMWIGKVEDQMCDYPVIDDAQLGYVDAADDTDDYDDSYQIDQPHDNQLLVNSANVTNNAQYRLIGTESEMCAGQQVDDRVPKVTLKIHRKVNKRKIAKRFLEIEERKAELLEKIETERSQPKDSDDLLFFKSLLGFMDTFTPAQNLRVRNKIQAVIFDEINASATYYPNQNEKFHI